MKGKTAVQMNATRSETDNSKNKNADRNKPDHHSRKPAVYRSVGIRVPGNNSLMVVHVTER